MNEFKGFLITCENYKNPYLFHLCDKNSLNSVEAGEVISFDYQRKLQLQLDRVFKQQPGGLSSISKDIT